MKEYAKKIDVVLSITSRNAKTSIIFHDNFF